MKSDQRSPSRPGRPATAPARSRSKFGRAVSDVWASLGGRSSQEQATEEAEAQREAELQLARAREILQQDRAMSPSRRTSSPPDDHVPDRQAIFIPEQTSTRARTDSSSAVREIADWIAEAIVDLPDDDLAGPIAVTAEPEGDAAATASLPPARLRLGLATTEMAVITPAGPTCREPIRTLTMARLLGKQGYRDRALSIYDHLLAGNPSDHAVRAEAELLRAGDAAEQPRADEEPEPSKIK